MESRTPSFDERYVDDLIQAGIAAVKAGRRKQARLILEKAARLKSTDARPWIWLSATTDDPEEQKKFLTYAVAAEPDNATARRGLVLLSEKLDKSRLVPEGETVEPRLPQEPEEARNQAYLCPQCGGQMAFDVETSGLSCAYCGHFKPVENIVATGEIERSIDFVLPTTRGHRWAEAQQRVACERCGAVTLLPPGQQADQCSYCGSNRLVQAAEAGDLLDPQAIGLLKVSGAEAAKCVKEWLGKGLFAPDDLGPKATGLHLRLAYYPFWAFDGTLELPWRCEVNEGDSNHPHWVPRSGSQIEFFDDVLVPGLKAISPEEAARIEPFNMKDLVEFKPEHLAGWVALGYDRPLSEASLLAREKVLKIVKRSLYSRIEPGREKRHLDNGAGKWSGILYKYLLLPVWVGKYRYQGKGYSVLINGQTGKVGGVKPRDNVKVALVSILVIIVAAIILYLVYTLLLSITPPV
ncbi:MAG: hypothetical protein EHM70_02890 [Chloroflexota bacterium]|nr:MAG: hypothetical protein EHM70_02890 [Chloroflexota bacterium]